jgi:chemotaxis signal transduction protein
MSGQPIESLFKDNSITVVSFSTKEASFAIPLDQVRYIEKDVKRNIQVGELNQFNHEVITYQNQAVPLYDFSALIGSVSSIEESKKLISILNEREEDHVTWLDSLEESIRNNIPFTKATDPNKCGFGVWYQSFTTNDTDLAEALKKFDKPHRHIHALAEELLNLAQNNQAKALERLAYERKTTLSQLQKLFEVARERVLNNIRPIIVFIEHNDKKIGALRLDNIKDIETYSIEQFSRDNSTEGIMKRNQNDFVIEGFLRQGDKAPCMLLNCQPQH